MIVYAIIRYYYRTGAHGDVTAVLDATGQAIKEYRYDAYGEEEPLRIDPKGDQSILYLWEQETEGVHNPFRYCGEYWDEETVDASDKMKENADGKM